MKRALLLLTILYSSIFYSQSTAELKFLDYAGQQLEIPENCKANSQYGLLDCNGFSVQWLYMTKAMVPVVPNQFIKEFTKKTKSKEKITVISFGGKLQGYSVEYKEKKETPFRLVVFGTVNNQPLLLNIGSNTPLRSDTDLNEFLKGMIQIL